MFSKKSKSEERIKDLALSCVKGTISVFNSRLNKTNINENFIKKFINLIFEIPKFQNIINSFFVSYFNRIYANAKKTENGKILLKIFGKLSNV